ncbi:hypothetical protein [Radiobacillus deserti]|uniref:hypothetical protein n=1 Tax=Radiobacillus deserti TaxID=2594883 RepID=UPI00389ABA60
MDRAGTAYDELYEWISNSEYDQVGSFGFEMYSRVHSPSERKMAIFYCIFWLDIQNCSNGKPKGEIRCLILKILVVFVQRIRMVS